MTNNETTKPGSILLAVPAVGVLAGVAYLVAGLVGDNVGFGVFGLVLMVAATLGFVFARRRSEFVQGLLDRKDERINHLDLLASTAAGMSVLIASVVMFVVEIARGEDGAPYYWLAALGGLVYIVAIVVLRFRR